MLGVLRGRPKRPKVLRLILCNEGTPGALNRGSAMPRIVLRYGSYSEACCMVIFSKKFVWSETMFWKYTNNFRKKIGIHKKKIEKFFWSETMFWSHTNIFQKISVFIKKFGIQKKSARFMLKHAKKWFKKNRKFL